MADPRMIVCPHCGSTNRVAGDKSLAEGKCGKCHGPLLDGQPADGDAAAFDKQITRSDVPVVVEVSPRSRKARSSPMSKPFSMAAKAFARSSRQMPGATASAQVSSSSISSGAGVPRATLICRLGITESVRLLLTTLGRYSSASPRM